ncbi:uncharacterized protein LOC120071124 isoform X2 [Benincasa hispida]|uniref:uncharacterized protein LOC120071124 isoform X1 n=1 Tax=Benincasa hispida TaxID=102211 RepID=UPI0018FF3F3F|nr:uncharacterized protein LOC120071124 isoform X1 [Benincasa hispida]XP_038879122.1 uncharacterized protein LOC120071124 isoform X2 [Benincasa hispida]
MQGTSKVILGATLIMVVSLAIVLGLILVLLAELYCSLLLRRRRLRVAPPTTTSNTSADPVVAATDISRSLPSAPRRDNNRSAISLSSLYAHGVLSAPRNFLFPTVPCVKDNNVTDVAEPEAKSQSSQLHRVIDIDTHESSLSPHRIGRISTPSHPPSPIISASADLYISKACALSKLNPSIACNDSSSNGSDHFMYISNPIYDNDAIRPSRGDTPFETPNSSPSGLERCSSSSEEDEIVASPSSTIHSLPTTPPLTPMKKLPAEACSVTLRDARSLGNSGSDSNTNNGLSSSSSGSPCTSPSW